MTLAVHLLGRPRLDRDSGEAYQFRSRKSWALLAYLLMSEHRPSRSQLASMLFAEADDPIRALRWSLSELRRGLGHDASLDGDPVVLQLPPGAIVDVDVVIHGTWEEAIGLPGLGAELLDGLTIRGAATFETWLLSKQRHLAAASEAILHEAALGSMSRGDLNVALGLATRVVAMSPLDENHQALLIRLYRMAGDDEAAERQYQSCTRLFTSELGVQPGPSVHAAMRENRREQAELADEATIEAVIEAGSAAVAAGALAAGVQSLLTAGRLADRTDSTRLRIGSRLAMAEALIHSVGGLDEEGLAALFEADDIAAAHGFDEAVAQARAELGYVDFLRARYDRAVLWLNDALRQANGSPSLVAKASTYLGSVESDRSNYQRAETLLVDAVAKSQVAGEPRREAYALSMLGRVSLLRGDLDLAADQLDGSIALADREHWLAFLPWPQALRGEVQVLRGDVNGAGALLEQAFARACQIGDPCWEGMSARGLALVAEATGRTADAFDILVDARVRSSRLADAYVWLGAYILDAQCELGLKHGHPDTARWVATMRELASRTGMRELTVRSLLHGAVLGQDGDEAAAALLAADLEHRPLVGVRRDGSPSADAPPDDPAASTDHEPRHKHTG